jgi:hypothetical protein
MSWKSEHMNLKPLPRGEARGGIKISDVPPRTPANDKRMRKRHRNLYGSTKFTDIQIVYFFLKHKGVCEKASAYLGYKSHWGFICRVRKIVYNGSPLKPQGKKKSSFTSQELQVAMELSKGVIPDAARLLGVNKSTVRQRCCKEGIKVRIGPRKGRSTTTLTYKESLKIGKLLIKRDGNIGTVAKELKQTPQTIVWKVARMYIIDVLGIGEYKKSKQS